VRNLFFLLFLFFIFSESVSGQKFNNKKEAKFLTKEGWKIIDNLPLYGKEKSFKEYRFKTIEEGLNHIYELEIGGKYLIGRGQAKSPMKVNGKNYHINVERVSLENAYDDLSEHNGNTITEVTNGNTIMKIINGDTTFLIKGYPEKFDSTTESMSKTNGLTDFVTNDIRVVEKSWISIDRSFPDDFEYTDIVLYRDGSIAILEVDRGEEYYYKYTNAKKDFLPEENNGTKIIMMIAREDDNGIKYVRTYIEELISNTLK